jgi:two-component system, NarL family, sensor histidine kinase UhpB
MQRKPRPRGSARVEPCRSYDAAAGADALSIDPGRACLTTLPTLLDRVHGGAVNAASEAIITVDEQQRIVMINPAAQRMFGCSAVEALGSPLSRFIPADRRDAHARLVAEFARAGTLEARMGEPGRVVGLRANGETFSAEASISRVAVSGPSGPLHYFTALLRDLSHEQELQQQIDALNRRMRAVFELAPVAIWITDGDRIVFANRACAALFGAAEREALIGRSIYDLLAPESCDAVRQTMTQALQGQAVAPTIHERIARLDGRLRDVVIAVASLPDHGRTVVQMVITDITERARENRELERSRRDLRRLSASMVQAREDERRRIARELHDELGQRLTALKMELSSLGGKAAGSPKAARIDAMLEMVDDTVATVRRIATELRPLMLDDLGLNAAIEWLADGWSRRMGVAVQLQLHAADAALDDAVSIALYRMVQEALTNIARHSRATEVRIDMRQVGGELLLTVQDNGTGFDEAAMYREGSHGLMGMRERALMLGGQLTIGMAPGGGGRVSVQLPLAPRAQSEAATRLPQEPAAPAKGSRRRRKEGA